LVSVKAKRDLVVAEGAAVGVCVLDPDDPAFEA